MMFYQHENWMDFFVCVFQGLWSRILFFHHISCCSFYCMSTWSECLLSLICLLIITDLRLCMVDCLNLKHVPFTCHNCMLQICYSYGSNSIWISYLQIRSMLHGPQSIWIQRCYSYMDRKPYESYSLTRRANAPYSPYWQTYSQLSPSHNLLSWKFQSLHETLQQNDWTSSRFPISCDL